MKFFKGNHLAVKVGDLESTARFYRDIVGLDVIREVKLEDGEKIIFLKGLEIHQKNEEELKNKSDSFGNSFFHFGIEVESIDKVLENLKKEKTFPEVKYDEMKFEEINQKAKFAFFSDPDGMTVEIVEWVKI